MTECNLEKIAEKMRPEVREALSADRSIDYCDEIRKIGWKPEIIPAEKTVTFRVSKGNTRWERKLSRAQLESAYEPEYHKWKIWKDLYKCITNDPSEFSE